MGIAMGTLFQRPVRVLSPVLTPLRNIGDMIFTLYISKDAKENSSVVLPDSDEHPGNGKTGNSKGSSPKENTKPVHLVVKDESSDIVKLMGVNYLKEKMEMELKVPPCSFRLSEPERHSTARLILRVRPNFKHEDKVRPWVTIEYSFNGGSGKGVLFAPSGMESGLEALLTSDDTDRLMASKDLIQNPTSPSERLYGSLAYIINHYDGEIWWNGFTMKLIGDPSTRLELIAHTMDPLSLTFRASSHQQIDVIRKYDRIDLIGKPLDEGVELKTFSIHGYNVPKINIVNPPNGTLVLNFPPYSV